MTKTSYAELIKNEFNYSRLLGFLTNKELLEEMDSIDKNIKNLEAQKRSMFKELIRRTIANN